MNLLLLAAALQSLDIEGGDVGETPKGWFLPQPSREAGWSAELTDEHPKAGKRCAVIAGGGSEGFGNLMRSVDAAPLRGKFVRFRAAVRVGAKRARLWLRVDRKDDAIGFFDNMSDRPIASDAWASYDIVGRVDADAEQIALGLMVDGGGRAWLDDVSLEAIDVQIEAPRALDGRGIDNLVAFVRLFGYVRHFYPGDESAAADWETFAFDGVKAVEKAADAKALAAALDGLFRPIAPAVRVFESGARPADLAVEKGDRVLAWRHVGYGQGREGSPYQSSRSSKKADALAKPFEADLGGGVSCIVPLEVWADDKGTLPRADRRDAKRPVFSGDDRATRLADVSIVWNVLQHFYPYFDVVKTDWPATLRRSLAAAAADADGRAFADTLNRLVADLHDGHGYVGFPGGGGPHALPIAWDWIEDRLVVTRAGEGVKGLKPGDVVRAIDGVDAVKALEAREALISGATPQWIRGRALNDLRAGPADSEVKLDVGSDVVRLRRAPSDQAPREMRPPKIHEVRKGVWYVDIDRINDKDFDDALADLDDADGIVFDLRGYPGNLSTVVIAHLIDKPVTCAQWHIPLVTRPDREKLEFQFSNWEVAPRKPRLTAKVAFITGGGAISYAETYLGIIEYYKLAAIVGGPTAGTNGNVNPLSLPGGYSVMWTGMKVLKHDGARHHGVGIQPTVPAPRTLKGVAAGRDEPLDKAIETVSD